MRGGLCVNVTLPAKQNGIPLQRFPHAVFTPCKFVPNECDSSTNEFVLHLMVSFERLLSAPGNCCMAGVFSLCFCFLEDDMLMFVVL